MKLVFGEMLLIGLRRKGLTYENLGLMIGVSKSAVGLYINGPTIPNKIECAQKIAKVLDFSESETKEFLKLYSECRSCYAKIDPSKNLRQQIVAQSTYIQELEDKIAELEARV